LATVSAATLMARVEVHAIGQAIWRVGAWEHEVALCEYEVALFIPHGRKGWWWRHPEPWPIRQRFGG
jgi:hypothetical protein